MKIILSRKGFDSQYGEMPSPIFDRKDMISMPVPSKDSLTYDDISYKGQTYWGIIKSLKSNTKIENYCHLDPDIRKDAIKRAPGWLPAFGQCDAAQGHLRNQGVKEGDLFLFFGWFQHAKWNNGKPEFEEDKYGFHAIFGYLQVGRIIRLGDGEKADECYADHPHVVNAGQYKKNNTLYVASENLSLNAKLLGAGPIKYHEGVELTKKGELKTHWDLPEYFKGMSYHTDKNWQKGYFKAADKGQEFVVDATDEIIKWVTERI